MAVPCGFSPFRSWFTICRLAALSTCLKERLAIWIFGSTNCVIAPFTDNYFVALCSNLFFHCIPILNFKTGFAFFTMTDKFVIHHENHTTHSFFAVRPRKQRFWGLRAPFLTTRKWTDVVLQAFFFVVQHFFLISFYPFHSNPNVPVERVVNCWLIPWMVAIFTSTCGPAKRFGIRPGVMIFAQAMLRFPAMRTNVSAGSITPPDPGMDALLSGYHGELCDYITVGDVYFFRW